MLNYNDLKKGVIFILDEEPWEVLEYEFLRMQQRKPVARTKVKNLISGKIVERTFHQNENFKEAEMQKTPLKYLYNHRGEFWFADFKNPSGLSPRDERPSSRIMLKEEVLGAKIKFLKPNSEVVAVKFQDKIINIELPIKMPFNVVEAPPSIKGNTAQGGTKQVTLETGAKVSVPLFIDQGETIIINTETEEYAGRP